jgi:hypothetical protein
MKFFSIFLLSFCISQNIFAQADSTAKTVKGFISSVTAYPNPFITTLKLKIITCVTGSVIIVLRDEQGKTVTKLTPFINKGSTEMIIPNVASLANGIYVLSVMQNGIMHTIKLIK